MFLTMGNAGLVSSTVSEHGDLGLVRLWVRVLCLAGLKPHPREHLKKGSLRGSLDRV